METDKNPATEIFTIDDQDCKHSENTEFFLQDEKDETNPTKLQVQDDLARNHGNEDAMGDILRNEKKRKRSREMDVEDKQMDEPRTKKAALERLRNMEFATRDPFKNKSSGESGKFSFLSRPRERSPPASTLRKSGIVKEREVRRRERKGSSSIGNRKRRSRSRNGNTRQKSDGNNTDSTTSLIESRHQRSTMFFLQNEQRAMSKLQRPTAVPTKPLQERIETLLTKPDNEVLAMPATEIKALILRGVELYKEQEHFLTGRKAQLMELDAMIAKERNEIERISQELPSQYRPPIIEEFISTRREQLQPQQVAQPLAQQESQTQLHLTQQPQQQKQFVTPQNTAPLDFTVPPPAINLTNDLPRSQQSQQQKQFVTPQNTTPLDFTVLPPAISLTNDLPGSQQSQQQKQFMTPQKTTPLDFSVPPPTINLANDLPCSVAPIPSQWMVPPPSILSQSANSIVSHFGQTTSLLFSKPPPDNTSNTTTTFSVATSLTNASTSSSVIMPNTSIPPPNLLQAGTANLEIPAQQSQNITQIVSSSLPSCFLVPPPAIMNVNQPPPLLQQPHQQLQEQHQQQILNQQVQVQATIPSLIRSTTSAASPKQMPRPLMSINVGLGVPHHSTQSHPVSLLSTQQFPVTGKQKNSPEKQKISAEITKASSNSGLGRRDRNIRDRARGGIRRQLRTIPSQQQNRLQKNYQGRGVIRRAHSGDRRRLPPINRNARTLRKRFSASPINISPIRESYGNTDEAEMKDEKEQELQTELIPFFSAPTTSMDTDVDLLGNNEKPCKQETVSIEAAESGGELAMVDDDEKIEEGEGNDVNIADEQ